jgi:hypothetical protein
VKQLTPAPGNPIALKHHGPFKIHTLYPRGPAPPTTTLPPSSVSTLPPRLVGAPTLSPSRAVISTTFATSKFGPELGAKHHRPFFQNHQVNPFFEYR